MDILECYRRGLFTDCIVTDGKLEIHCHRIILCQNIYFQKILVEDKFSQEEFSEKNMKGNQIIIKIVPPIDPNFDFQFVERVISQIYDTDDLEFEFKNLKESMSMLATCCYFMDFKMAEKCLIYLMKNVSIDNLSRLIDWVDDFDYGEEITGKSSKVIIDFLCIHYEKAWDQIPIHWAIELISLDKILIQDEFSRYMFLVRKLFGLSELDMMRMEDLKQLSNEKKEGISKYDDKITFENKIEILKQAIHYHHLPYDQISQIKQNNLVPRDWIDELFWDQQIFIRKVLEAKSENVFVNMDEVNLKPASLDQDRRARESSVDTLVNEPLDEDQNDHPAFRNGFTFSNKAGVLVSGSRVYSEMFFYAGSQWTVEMQKVLFENDYSMSICIRRWIPNYNEHIQANINDEGEDDGDSLKTPINPRFIPYSDYREQIGMDFTLHLMVDNKFMSFGPKTEVFGHEQIRGWLSKDLYHDLLGTEKIQGTIVLSLN